MSHTTFLRTMAALGPASIGRVALYRILLRSGRHPAQRIAADVPHGPFFAPPSRHLDLPPANDRWAEHLWWFGWFRTSRVDGPPDWHATPFGNARGDETGAWWTIPDFVAGMDVKNVWELSRFGWLPALATQAAHGDCDALATINEWLETWSRQNPPYLGVNWKCGQEASLRIIHLAAAAMILEQDKAPAPGLVDLIAAHLKRVAPTMSYAIGQNNNHGTSEASAMFIGGSWLSAAGWPGAERWARIGRRWLENRARRLIGPDGSFSQYSVVYHRLMLDSYVFAETWRRWHGLPPFSAELGRRLESATHWLDAMVDRDNGDAPNLGANDGAHILPLTPSDYRDFRPSLQAASVTFRKRRALREAGQWDDQLHWLRIDVPSAVAALPRSESFDWGGIHFLRHGSARGYLRYPRLRFRPGQSDLLHFDLWVGTRNLLRDAGTLGYNVPGATELYAGAGAHNTIQFDDRDQMPRLGRFLFGAWPKAFGVKFATQGERAECAAGYVDYKGASHHRTIQLQNDGFTCIDDISGNFEHAVLRWRLEPGKYCLTEGRLIGPDWSVAITVDGTACEISLIEGVESRYYLKQENIPVLHCKVKQPCRIITTGRF